MRRKAGGDRYAVFAVIREDGRVVARPALYAGDGVWLVGERMTSGLGRIRASDIEYAFVELPGYKPPIYRGVPLIIAWEKSSVLLDDTVFAYLYDSLKREERGETANHIERLRETAAAKIAAAIRDGREAVDVEARRIPLVTAVDPRQVEEFSAKTGLASAIALAGRISADLNRRFYILFSRVTLREMLDVVKLILMMAGAGLAIYMAAYALKMLTGA